MARRFLFLLLILCPILAYSQSSTAPEKESMICLSESEWEKLEDQIWAETQQTVKEAVDAAIKPHVEYEASLRAKLDEDSRTILFWKITTGVSAGLAVVFAVLFAVSRLISPMP